MGKSPLVPLGVNLTGTWELRDEYADARRQLNAAIRKTDGVGDRIIRQNPPMRGERPSQIPPRRVRGGLVYVFLVTGRTLKITQTPDGLFLSFDRAVVEEFRFGENREVRVGPVVADRVSGWEGDAYVVETLDQSGMKLTERYSLSENGNTLSRTITLRSKNEETESVIQTFDRVR